MKIAARKLNVTSHSTNFNENIKFSNFSFEHRKIRLKKQQYCTSCTKNDRKIITITRR